MAERPRIRDPTSAVLDRIKEDHDYPSTDAAIRHALREAGYDV